MAAFLDAISGSRCASIGLARHQGLFRRSGMAGYSAGAVLDIGYDINQEHPGRCFKAGNENSLWP